MSAGRARVLVVDDERPARAKVVRLLALDDRFQLVGEAADGLSALRAADAERPDVLILDIQMPGIDGFDVLEALGPERPVVVFSTAHDAHALRAFDAHAVDYLLKPYDAERFRRALDKAYAQLLAPRPDALAALAARARRQDRIVLRTAEGWIHPPLASIVRITASGKHVEVVTTEGVHRVRGSLRALTARLEGARFVQVHRGEVVNLGAVARLEPWAHGDAILVMRDGSSVVLSRTYRRAFLQRFGVLGGRSAPPNGVP